MSVKILPYARFSHGARVLAEAMDCYRVLNLNNIHTWDTIISWGWNANNNGRTWNVRDWFNKVDAVGRAKCKLATLRSLAAQDVPHPPFTNDRSVAVRWRQEGETVVCRRTTTGTGGSGIVVVDDDNPVDIPVCPLYTKYIPKKKEFRVHVAFGRVIDVAQKVKRRDSTNEEFRIRSHINGFVFQQNNIEVPNVVREVAVRGCQSLGLDFGGVDVIWNEKNAAAYVLEINTAPGLENTQTIQAYARAFTEEINARQRRRS